MKLHCAHEKTEAFEQYELLCVSKDSEKYLKKFKDVGDKCDEYKHETETNVGACALKRLLEKKGFGGYFVNDLVHQLFAKASTIWFLFGMIFCIGLFTITSCVLMKVQSEKDKASLPTMISKKLE